MFRLVKEIIKNLELRMSLYIARDNPSDDFIKGYKKAIDDLSFFSKPQIKD